MQLSNKDIRTLNKEISERYSLEDVLKKKSKVEKKDEIIYCDAAPIFFTFEEKLVPTLKFLLEHNFLPRIVVDMPAVPFMVKGADVMRPGIKEIDTFDKGSFVAIVDENNKKPLAIGKALFSSQEMKEMDKGKVISNIHFVGDEIWNA